MLYVCVAQPSSPPLPPSGKLTAYDTDGDGDFDVEDAKVLLGKFTLILFHRACSLCVVCEELMWFTVMWRCLSCNINQSSLCGLNPTKAVSEFRQICVSVGLKPALIVCQLTVMTFSDRLFCYKKNQHRDYVKIHSSAVVSWCLYEV